MAGIAPGHNLLLLTNYSNKFELFVKVSCDLWLVDIFLIVVVETSIDKVLWSCSVANVVN
jgi:hypothetical protein